MHLHLYIFGKIAKVVVEMQVSICPLKQYFDEEAPIKCGEIRKNIPI